MMATWKDRWKPSDDAAGKTGTPATAKAKAKGDEWNSDAERDAEINGRRRRWLGRPRKGWLKLRTP